MGLRGLELRAKHAVAMNRSVASEASTNSWNVELWSDPVDTQKLLQKISAKIRKYIVLRPEALIATALWTMTAWAHEGAAHSPILAAISVEPDSGKSTSLAFYVSSAETVCQRRTDWSQRIPYG